MAIADERGEDGRRSRAGQVGSADAAVRLARGLGWFSIGLGVAQIVAPRALGAIIGIQRPWTLRALGVREIATGAAILTQPREPAYLWARVGGDAMDLALLGGAFAARDAGRIRLTAAVGLVAAVTAMDMAASRRLATAVSGQHAAPVEISLSVAVDRSADELYRFWRNLANLPRFMQSVREVHALDEQPPERARRWRWVMAGPAGSSFEWTSEITEDRPAQLIAWRSSGSLLSSEGSVHFAPAPDGEGTLVRLRLRYAGDRGAAASAVARLLRELPRQKLKGELRRFKQLIETGEIATTEGQPSGPRSATVRWFNRALESFRQGRGAAQTHQPRDAGADAAGGRTSGFAGSTTMEAGHS